MSPGSMKHGQAGDAEVVVEEQLQAEMLEASVGVAIQAARGWMNSTRTCCPLKKDL